MTVRLMIPFRSDRNLGRAYNDEMKRLPDGDWAAFLDHDAMPTTLAWHAQLEEAIAFKPDAGAFVAMTNRIAKKWQRCGDANNNDMAWHRKFGQARRAHRTLLDITDTLGWGGVFFAVSKKAWEQVGGFADGAGCVDHSLHFRLQRAGLREYLIEGLYVYHWMHWHEKPWTSPATSVQGCPHHGHETEPTVRLTLP